MGTKEFSQKLSSMWSELYGTNNQQLFEQFVKETEQFKLNHAVAPLEAEWYKDAVIYSLYVDLFSETFQGLEKRLDYLSSLGVSCLWLLPILDSPMRDAGFDISNYQSVRPGLMGLDPGTPDFNTKQAEIFGRFLEQAHERGIRVIFDIAINHTSNEHPWFTESRKGPDNPYRDYYIWSDTDQKYKDARIIFYGIEESNWTQEDDLYFFHRFFDFMPDLNYRNPQVLVEMSRNMLFWLGQGVDGFRADAIPYLWKEEGTDCENLPKTHTLVKFFRTVIEYVRPNTLLLAEACQKPHEVVKYFGDNDECNAGYHFPLMPQMFKALAARDKKPITETLSLDVTPAIPDSAQWLTFLRCHDELSLELVYVSEEDRKFIHDNYCLQPEWDFRLGQGISARLAELLDRNPKKIGLLYSIMLSLPGTPVIYYGDEFGKLNDMDYYKEQIALTGKDDTRFLVRGKMDWDWIDSQLENPKSFESKVFKRIQKLIDNRKKFNCFGRGSIQFLDVSDLEGNILKEVLAYIRSYEDEHVLVLNNLSGKKLTIQIPDGYADIKQEGDNKIPYLTIEGRLFEMKRWGYHWVQF